ncbi:hypothetical protein AAZX31_16G068000 [Glycine max]|uniref:Uncharacterized protein n=2 Tax=Glycine subgen. Soja TaxID=1462606 RepID=I1MLW3_SOYBN|nr:hypothetical protein JHK86_044631 [Glycine max]RZB59984.1 hypothetical protein D0Y65_042958 [Glycine soja]KAG4951373.1 hypothetical protein JHK85_045240 [Glycine max]KAG5099229.1 hypothetical protein JHK82_044281 [Glycine max]KAG5107835.1 hypothetical protein JHK84_044742 [Glycine max]
MPPVCLVVSLHTTDVLLLSQSTCPPSVRRISYSLCPQQNSPFKKLLTSIIKTKTHPNIFHQPTRSRSKHFHFFTASTTDPFSPLPLHCLSRDRPRFQRCEHLRRRDKLLGLLRLPRTRKNFEDEDFPSKRCGRTA